MNTITHAELKNKKPVVTEEKKKEDNDLAGAMEARRKRKQGSHMPKTPVKRSKSVVFDDE